MNKLRWTVLFVAVFILGVLLSYLGMIPVVALLGVIVALLILLADYEKATIIVALFTVVEFVLRDVIAYGLIASVWDEVALLLCFGLWLYKWFA